MSQHAFLNPARLQCYGSFKVRPFELTNHPRFNVLFNVCAKKKLKNKREYIEIKG